MKRKIRKKINDYYFREFLEKNKRLLCTIVVLLIALMVVVDLNIQRKNYKVDDRSAEDNSMTVIVDSKTKISSESNTEDEEEIVEEVTYSDVEDEDLIENLNKKVDSIVGVSVSSFKINKGDFGTIFEYINKKDKIIFSNLSDDDNYFLFYTVFNYGDVISKYCNKKVKCEDDTCYEVSVSEIEDLAQELFNIDTDFMDEYSTEDDDNYIVNSIDSIIYNIENSDDVSIKINDKTEEITYQKEYRIASKDLNITVEYLFKLEDDNYYLYSMSKVD